MIKCKEDLINTAVFCHKGELRELYLKKCEQFGVSWNHAGLDINKYSLLMVDENTELQGVICCNDDFYLDLKRLTLSDLKPRTRTEYEKVTESIFDLRDEFERGELYTKGRGVGGDFFKEITTEYELITFASCGLYRKVEKEIDERQEFIDAACEVVDWNIKETMGKLYDAGFRVALRASGEIE